MAVEDRPGLLTGGLYCLSRCSATIASILRIRVIYLATKGSDPAWDKAPNALLGAVEVDLGLICSCAVTLMPLFRRWFPAAWPKGLRRSEANPQRAVPVPGSMSSGSNYIEFEPPASNTNVGGRAGSTACLWGAR